MIKIERDIFDGFIDKNFIKLIVDKSVFPDDLKHTDITPIQKNKVKSDKTNYRSVRIFMNN